MRGNEVGVAERSVPDLHDARPRLFELDVKKPRKFGDKLVLKDEHGKERIVLDASCGELPFVRLIGKNGAALTLEIDGDNPHIILQPAGGKHGMILVAGREERSIVIYDKSGYPSVRIRYSGETNEPTIERFVHGQPRDK